MDYGTDIYNMMINEKGKKYNPRHYVQDESILITEYYKISIY